jgi:hypothetical protein
MIIYGFEPAFSADIVALLHVEVARNEAQDLMAFYISFKLNSMNIYGHTLNMINA